MRVEIEFYIAVLNMDDSDSYGVIYTVHLDKWEQALNKIDELIKPKIAAPNILFFSASFAPVEREGTPLFVRKIISKESGNN